MGFAFYRTKRDISFPSISFAQTEQRMPPEDLCVRIQRLLISLPRVGTVPQFLVGHPQKAWYERVFCVGFLKVRNRRMALPIAR
jgi:hypothetical protein